MIDWKKKLSSRKFWMAIIGFITAIMYGLNVASADIEKTTSIIMAGATMISYILAEGFVDAKRINTTKKDDENW